MGFVLAAGPDEELSVPGPGLAEDHRKGPSAWTVTQYYFTIREPEKR